MKELNETELLIAPEGIEIKKYAVDLHRKVFS